MQDQEIKIGTIFCKCWGYSMRLYDFYQVTKVSGKTFTFVKLEKNEQVGSESGRPIVTPIISSCAIAKMNGETFKKRLNKYGFFKDIGNTIWDGQPKIEDHWD